MQELLQFVFEPIAEFLFLLIGYPIGAVFVVLVSFGRLLPGPIQYSRDSKFYRSRGMKWWHATYLDGGQRYLPAETVAGIAWILIVNVGILVWVLMH